MKGPVAVLTNVNTTKDLRTPYDCSAIHVLWEVLNASDNTPVADASVYSLDFKVILPHGTEIPFDGTPFVGNLNEVSPFSIAGGIPFRVTATGITDETVKINIYVIGIY
jgi:hypothetical protein